MICRLSFQHSFSLVIVIFTVLASVDASADIFGSLIDNFKKDRKTYSAESVCNQITTNTQIQRYLNVSNLYFETIYDGSTSDRTMGPNTRLVLDSNNDLIYTWVYDSLVGLVEKDRYGFEKHDKVFEFQKALYDCAYSLRDTEYIRAFTQTSLSYTNWVTGWKKNDSGDVFLDASGNLAETANIDIRETEHKYMSINIQGDNRSSNYSFFPVAAMAAALPNGETVLQKVADPVMDQWLKDVEADVERKQARWHGFDVTTSPYEGVSDECSNSDTPGFHPLEFFEFFGRDIRREKKNKEGKVISLVAHANVDGLQVDRYFFRDAQQCEETRLRLARPLERVDIMKRTTKALEDQPYK